MRHQIVEIAESPVSLAMDRAPIGSMPCEGTGLRLRNERSVRVRPVRPADAETIQEFVRRLSVTSRRLRFFSPIRELTPAMLARITDSAGRGRVLIAEAHDGETGCMVAMAQYAPSDDDGGTCELALVVADAWQRLGLGHSLLEMLIQSARDARYVRAVADVLHDNEAMLALGRAYDFTVVRSPYGATMLRLERDLQDVMPTGRAWNPQEVRHRLVRLRRSLKVGDGHTRVRTNMDLASQDAAHRENPVHRKRPD